MAYYHTVPSYVSNYGQVVKMGQLDANPRGLGPPPPNAYKRAVLRDPPKQFKVSVLPPKKLGSGWAYGVQVVSTVEDEASDLISISSRSIASASTSSYKDYEIRRRWDDCLWFQDKLELEYSIQAREKRRRLEQGKGVKKNGVYLDSKQAASFDSLPPGPDPTSVSLDVHDYIPKLSKKGTLFRANQATIDQRQQQFACLVDALFSPEVPTLIEELRKSRTVKDFFGWWRRDKDFARKQGPDKGKNPQSPALHSIPFYLETSNSSLDLSSPASSFKDLSSPRAKHTRPTTADATTSDSIRHNPHNRTREDPSRRRKTISAATSSAPAIAISSASTNGSHESRPSSQASIYSAIAGEMSPTVVMWDGQEQLNASDRVSPQALLNAFPQTPMVKETFENIQCPPSPDADSPILGLEALPEELELEMPLYQMSVQEHEHEHETRSPITRSRGNSVSGGRNRNAIVFSSSALGDGEIPVKPDRLSTMTNTTAASSQLSSLSNASTAPSWRTSASDLLPCPSPRRSLDSCTTDAIEYSGSGFSASPQSPWLSDDDTPPVLGPSIKRGHRESIMSINSIMSDTSVDQVLPRGTYMAPQSGYHSMTRSSPPAPRNRSQRAVPRSVPEEDVYSEDCDDGMLESYLYGIEEMDASGEPEIFIEDHSPYREPLSQRPTSEQLPKPFQNRPPEQFHLPWSPTSPNMEGVPKSPTSPASTASVNTVYTKTISIKVYMTENTIIVFRAPTEITYAEIRDKIYDKFVNQEGISLRPDFHLAFIAPTSSRRSVTSSVYSGITRKRAGSVGSASSNDSSLLPVQSREVWDEVVRDTDGKLTLRVFG